MKDNIYIVDNLLELKYCVDMLGVNGYSTMNITSKKLNFPVALYIDGDIIDFCDGCSDCYNSNRNICRRYTKILYKDVLRKEKFKMLLYD